LPELHLIGLLYIIRVGCKLKVCIRQNFDISVNKYVITEKERNGKQKNEEIEN